MEVVSFCYHVWTTNRCKMLFCRQRVATRGSQTNPQDLVHSTPIQYTIRYFPFYCLAEVNIIRQGNARAIKHRHLVVCYWLQTRCMAPLHRVHSPKVCGDVEPVFMSAFLGDTRRIDDRERVRILAAVDPWVVLEKCRIIFHDMDAPLFR